MLDVARLRLLREVAARGTIAAAAKALAYTPSAVSQQLSKLEKEVGAPLLERSGRGVALTEVGRTLVAHSDEVFRALDRAEAAAEAAKGVVGGSLRVGAFASAATEIVAPAIRSLRVSAPQLRVELSEMEDPESIVGLRLGHLDLIVLQDFTHVPSRTPTGLTRHPLVDDPLVLAVPREWGIATVSSLDELRDRPWIAEPEENPSGRALRHACRAAGFEPEIRYQVLSFQVMAALVARGLGVALVPALVVRGRETGLQIIQLPGVVRHIYAATRHERVQRPAVRATLEAIRETAAAL
jgi:molybdate transport repressor ModE-like protein